MRRLVRSLSLIVVALLAAASSPPAAQAAVCADYSDQAAAQAAADTRDADGDGIYCESLPCPCSTGASSTSKPAPVAAPKKKRAVAAPRLGAPVLLAPVTQKSGCLVEGPLPDADCTPGAYYPLATKAKVCKAGYSKLVRNVSESTKDAIYSRYGIDTHFDGTTGEVDHLVSLELGGSNSQANLFPEAASPAPGSHEKDRLENALHIEVCDGEITLRHAQRLIAGDWVTAYNDRF